MMVDIVDEWLDVSGKTNGNWIRLRAGCRDGIVVL